MAGGHFCSGRIERHSASAGCSALARHTQAGIISAARGKPVSLRDYKKLCTLHNKQAREPLFTLSLAACLSFAPAPEVQDKSQKEPVRRSLASRCPSPDRDSSVLCPFPGWQGDRRHRREGRPPDGYHGGPVHRRRPGRRAWSAVLAFEHRHGPCSAAGEGDEVSTTSGPVSRWPDPGRVGKGSLPSTLRAGLGQGTPSLILRWRARVLQALTERCAPGDWQQRVQ